MLYFDSSATSSICIFFLLFGEKRTHKRLLIKVLFFIEFLSRSLFLF